MTSLTNFQKDALAYDKHISLTANAGSGKTTVLANRYVEILLNENISVSNVVAITFTERAASELYSKIVREVEKRITESPGQDSKRLNIIRRALVSAKISTIHAFCIDILKEFAPEIGIDANFSPIDARTSDEILSQCIDELLSEKLNENNEETKDLIRIFGSRSQLTAKIKQLFNKRKSTEYLIDTVYNKDPATISNKFKENFENLFNELFGEKVEKIYENVKLINSLAGEYKSSEKFTVISGILQNSLSNQSGVQKFISLSKIRKELLTSSGSITMRGYLSKKIYNDNLGILEATAELFKEINEIEIDENYEDYNFDLANFGKQISSLYILINRNYAERKYQKSFLDFEDLLILTQKLLLNETVKNELSVKYKYIMIDEYQDTNETQYNIFMPILKNLKSGNLFIVGDEKQSIYMFREAEVELFDKTREEINTVSRNAGIMELPHSFRLAPNIALFTNVLFRRIFSSPDPRFNEVAHNDLISAYNGEKNGKVEFLLAEDENVSEGELVAGKILQIVNNPGNDFTFSDISVLCTKRKNFSELENIFSIHKIPYSIIGGKGFYQQQIITDFYNYISFLVNPMNDLALASVLRSPFYGLSDPVITGLVISEGNHLFNKLSRNTEFKSIFDLLKEHLDSAKVLRPNELIRKIANDTGYWAYSANKESAEQEIANLNKLIEKSIFFDEQGFSTLFDLASYLGYAINNHVDEGQAETDSISDAVKIMTVHQSKGLEFKVVVLFKTNQRIFDEKLKSKEISVDKNFGILAKLPFKNNYFEGYNQAPIIGIYNYLQRRKSFAEYKRLLYVALTRAEEYLLISMSGSLNKLSSGSFAELIFSNIDLDSGQDILEIADELKFMELKDNKYQLRQEYISHKISLTREIQADEVIGSETSLSVSPLKINTRSIITSEKNEIISASKISLFLNCPRKYELTYEFGYGELTRLFLRPADIEFNQQEDEPNVGGSLLGNILHALLEKNADLSGAEIDIDRLIANEKNITGLTENSKKEIKEKALEILDSFYSSKLYSRLGSFGEYYNEIEFYKRENDYYLYGIIDKLILNKDKIIIADYKSDSVKSRNYEEKVHTYTNQLFFYAYLILSRFPDVKEFELLLLFLRDHKFFTSLKVERAEIERFGEVIEKTVDKIRNKRFNEAKEGCRNMDYYLLPEL